MKDINAREEVLRSRLAELGGRLQRIEHHLEQPPNPDWADNAIEAEMDEVLEGLGQAGTTEVDLIQIALARIKSGTYGVCVRCRNDISDERLDAIPHAALCRTCAANATKTK